MIYADVIENTISPAGVVCTTFEIEFHRFVLAEFNTHRVFSRNSASSRAIPVTKQLERVRKDPAFPMEWVSEQPGMQGGQQLTGWDLEMAQKLFEDFQFDVTQNIGNYIAEVSRRYQLEMDDKELKPHLLHKSLINRLLEPIMWHKVIVTATNYENFYNQRCSPLAQAEIRLAAEAMEALRTSPVRVLQSDGWHLPYISDEERDLYSIESAKRISAARCARVSYLTHDGQRDPQEDLKLYERLSTAKPPHWSPMEHQATPYPQNSIGVNTPDGYIHLPVIGNLLGFRQQRHEGWSIDFF